jgi:hypothetical protein
MSPLFHVALLDDVALARCQHLIVIGGSNWISAMRNLSQKRVLRSAWAD